jgi:pilus assembly protein CpaC
MRHRSKILICLTVGLSLGWTASTALPQAPQEPPAATPQRPKGPATQLPLRALGLTAGRGQLVQFEDDVSRVSVSDPAIADAVVVSPNEVVLNGKSIGHTTIMIWHGDFVTPFELTVEADLSEIQSQLKASFPNEQIGVSSSKDSIFLTGVVTNSEVVKQAQAIATVHAKNVVNLLQAPPPDLRQVMLQVKFASIDRTALSQIGVNLFSVNNKLVGTTTTQQFSFPRLGQLQFSPGIDGRPVLGNQQVTASDLLNLFLFRPDVNIGVTLRLLQDQNLLEILEEPNLVTVSGREASFLAGGEFPYPVISTTGSGAQATPVVTIQFRPFGVKLNFTPTVAPNGLIHLKVQPEVSALDYANALTIQGFLIPAISTRKAETEVDLREGESFAIAGLIDNRVNEVVSKIPGIGDMPILGHLFRSRSMQKTNSELLVLVTPNFVKPFAPGDAPPLPQFPERFLDSNPEQSSATSPTFVGPRGQVGGGAP